MIGFKYVKSRNPKLSFIFPKKKFNVIKLDAHDISATSEDLEKNTQIRILKMYFDLFTERNICCFLAKLI